MGEARPRFVESLPRIQIPDHRQDDISRSVVAQIIVEELLPGEAPQVLLAADPPAPDPVDTEGQFVQLLGGVGGGVVDLASPFLDDGFDFPRQLITIHQRVRERIGQDVQALGEGRGGEGHIVVGEVVVGSGVEFAADRFDLAGDPVGRGTEPRPLEEHVLDDMGNSDLIVLFVEVPGLHPDADGHHGRDMDLLDQDGESVVQRLADDVVG